MSADNDFRKPAILRLAESGLHVAALAFARVSWERTEPELIDELERDLRKAAAHYETVRRAVEGE